MHKSAKIVISAVIIIVIGVIMASADQELEISKPKGVLFYSSGANLYKYDFNSGEEQVLFDQRKGLASQKEISSVDWPSYLKSKNKIILEGYGFTYQSRIFECDLNGNNWIEYENPKNLHTLSISPDGTKIVFGRFIKSPDTSKIVLPKDYRYQLVIKEYADLNKNGGEQVVVEDFCGYPPCVWESNDVILYSDSNWNTIRFDLKSEEKKVVLKGLAPIGVSKDRELLFCSDSSSERIYLVKKGDYIPILLKKFNSSISWQIILSPDNRYFVFTKTRIFSLSEKKDTWLYDLKKGKERLLIKEASIAGGGFWLE